MSSQYEAFKKECSAEIAAQGINTDLKKLSNDWITKANAAKYSYHFEWLGRPVMQYPQDLMMMQELIFSVQPDIIIETGIAHGGSLIFYASMLELLAACGGNKDAGVIGIDIEIRPHNRAAIEAHPMHRRINMIEADSAKPETAQKVAVLCEGKKVLVCLDSSRAHDHVLAELRAYAPLVSVGSYCVVFNTIVEHLPPNTHPGKPWNVGSNPHTAVTEFLKENRAFQADKNIDNKLLISVCPDGYLKRLS